MTKVLPLQGHGSDSGLHACDLEQVTGLAEPPLSASNTEIVTVPVNLSTIMLPMLVSLTSQANLQGRVITSTTPFPDVEPGPRRFGQSRTASKWGSGIETGTLAEILT